ncbi:hypothetical protein N8I77_012469 [Diaporthe amygdali]|uniref:B30.2/SPRY domain-containing protein n=1 Tax=Phomopsis amygdali TaxID=1214568 RepID=A0AAD9VXA3_PHOAM|nr:hypothetical protein N8I77_012469 [Diaporthe amygdali]
MSTQHQVINTTSLWEKAHKKFTKSNPKADSEFLMHNDTPKDLTTYLRGKKHEAARKYQRYGTVLERLDVIAGIGDIAMKAAPESVGLVWTGFRFVFTMIHSDKEMCSALVDAVDFFSEVVLVCQIYGRRYANSDKQNPITKRVLPLIPKVLSSVMQFSYLVQKFFKQSSNHQVRILRNLFYKFGLQDTIQKCKTECESLRELDDVDFKEELREEKQVDEITVNDEFGRNNEWFRRGQIAGQNLAGQRHSENLDQRHKHSCEWIFETQVIEYHTWINYHPEEASKSQQGKLAQHRTLWLHGDGGVGKSVLVSTIIHELENKKKHLVVYFFCKLGDYSSQNGAQIMLKLCAQLFQKGGEGNLDVRRVFNEVMNETREDMPESEKGGPPNIRISTTRSLFQKLANALGKEVTIAVDGLDECADDDRSGFLKELKVLARSSSIIRVLVSSRSSPDTPDIPSILIDKSRTENDIRRYLTANIKDESAVEEIIKKSEGRFRYARMVVKSHQSSTAGVQSLNRRMKDLPSEMNDLYRQRFCLLNDSQKDVLVTVLRWLICRGDRIELLPIADELAEKYSPEESNYNSPSGFPSLQDVAKSLTEIGRDFLKVKGKTVQLDHKSVRDFIEFSSREDRDAGETCRECGKRDPVDVLSQAAGKEGKLKMAEYMVQTINSSKYQKEYILFEESERNAKVKRSKDTLDSKKKPMRYEASSWYKHLRDAEAVWTTNERESVRWKALYEQTERFLLQESKAYQHWQIRKNETDYETGTHDHPLYTAARYGLEGLIERYLDKGCDVNVKNRHQNTLLHRICMNNANYCGFAGLNIILNHNASVNEKNEEGRTPLLEAFTHIHGIPQPIKDLLQHGADPDITDNFQQSCLHYAARAHNIDACRELLPASHLEGSKERINRKDHHGETPLHWACKSKAPKELIEFLLDHGAELKAKDKEQQTPLYEACRVGNEAVARLLLEKKADIHDKDFKGDTALHAAVFSGDESLVKLLVQQGAQIDARNESLRTPLMLAASRSEWDIMFHLLESHKRKKGSMDTLLQPDFRGDTPLSLAVSKRNRKAVQKLLDKTSVEATLARQMCQILDSDNNQLLHKAASRGYAEICQLLMEHGAGTDVNGKANEYGSTPLDAAFSGWQERSGSDTSRLKDFENTVKALLSQPNEVTGKSRKFICATWRGSLSVCDHFKSLKASIDEHGWNPAMIGASFGNSEVAHIMASDSDGKLIDQLLSGTSPSEPHGHKPSMWSGGKKHDAVTLSKNKMVAYFRRRDDFSKEAAVFANHPVPAGLPTFYYEVKIDKIDKKEDNSVKFGVGFCTELAYYNSIPGSTSSNAPSWGYQGNTGSIFTRFDNGHKDKQKPGSTDVKTFGVGDTIGCGIDFANGLGHGKIFYTRNGQHLGIAFEEVSGRLFPVVGSRLAGVKMEVNFGSDAKKPFVWKDVKVK